MSCGPRHERPARLVRLLGLIALCAVATPVHAATEIYLDGYFRLRARLFDNLFLKRDVRFSENDDPALAGSDGTTNYFQQRLRIQPELRVNQYLSVFAQLDVLPDLIWGTNPERLAGLDAYYEPIGQSQSFYLPNDTPLIAPRRVWAEVYTPIGRLKIGRAAQQVGAGIYFNDGNDLDADYGDTADRVQFLTRFGHVYVLLGYDMIYEGALDRPYDAQAGAAAIAYRTELLSGSFYTYIQEDRSWPDEGTIGADPRNINHLRTFTFDLWGKATIGPVDLEAEAIYRYGSGDLVLEAVESGVEPKPLQGVTLSQYGGMLRGSYASRFGRLGVETGLASGDPDSLSSTSIPSSTTALKFTRFTFDRDYHIGFLMFRQPMPARASRASDTSSSDIYDTAVTGNAVSNAFYLVPSVEFNVINNVTARLSGVGAWAMETNADLNNARDYGYEVDLDLKSKWFDKLTLGGKAALFFPGAVYKDNREFAFGGELRAIVEF